MTSTLLSPQCAGARGERADVHAPPRVPRTAPPRGAPSSSSRADAACTCSRRSSASPRRRASACTNRDTRNSADEAAFAWASSADGRRRRPPPRILRPGRGYAAAVTPREWISKPPQGGSRSARRQRLGRVIGVRSLGRMPTLRGLRPIRRHSASLPTDLPVAPPGRDDFPVVVVVDTGVSKANPALNSWVVGGESSVAHDYRNTYGCGSFSETGNPRCFMDFVSPKPDLRGEFDDLRPPGKQRCPRSARFKGHPGRAHGRFSLGGRGVDPKEPHPIHITAHLSPAWCAGGLN